SRRKCGRVWRIFTRRCRRQQLRSADAGARTCLRDVVAHQRRRHSVLTEPAWRGHSCSRWLFKLAKRSNNVASDGERQTTTEALMSTELASRTCVPCRGGVPPLKGKELAEMHKQLPDFAHWKVVNEHHLTRAFTFPDFAKALDFVNRVGA